MMNRSGESWQFDYQGTFTWIFKNWQELTLPARAGGVITILKDEWLARADFMPLGENNYVHGHKTEALQKGYEGLETFLAVIGKHYPGLKRPLPLPRYMVGTTNKRMAKIINRLGFEPLAVTDEYTYPKLMIKEPKSGEDALIGDPVTIALNFTELKQREVGGRSTLERLAERVNRDQKDARE